MGRVIVIGSINNDLVVTADRHPKPGETLHGDSFNHYPGGKGANQAIAAAKAGAEVYMIGQVGDDEAGTRLCKFLAKSGVDITNVDMTSMAPTGTAIITVAKGENTIIVIGGANDAVNKEQINSFSFTNNDIVVARFETPVAATFHAFKKAKQANARTLLNPAPASETSQELLDMTDYLVVNEHEYELIFNQPLDSLLETEKLPVNYKGVLVVTLGRRGAALISTDAFLKQASIEVQAVDSTGAGDCFVGYFAAAISQGQQLDKALEVANKAATLSVTKDGAAISMPSITDLD